MRRGFANAMDRQAETRPEAKASFWSTGPGSYLLVFVLAGVGAYLIALRFERGADAPELAATIVHRLPANTKRSTEESSELLRLAAENVRRAITSEENVRAAGQRLKLGFDDAAFDRVVQNLHVETVEEPTAEQLRITISLLGRPDPFESLRLVNDLAEHYVDTNRTRLEAAARQRYEQAFELAEQGRLEMVRAQAELDASLDEHFKLYAKRTEELAKNQARRKETPVESRPPVAEPRMVPNPARGEVQREIARLEQYRRRLLVDRTARHPEVGEVDTEMAGLKRRLESLPELIASDDSAERPEPVEESAVGTPPEQSSAEPADSLARRVRGRRAEVTAFNARQAALARARERYQQLAAAEREAWRGRLRVAGFDLQLAQLGNTSGKSDHRAESLLIALVAALAVTGVVSLFSSGSGGRRTFTSPAQVEAELGLPVVGVVPEPLGADQLATS